MSTIHIAAEVGDIAKTVLLPGDPLRAKFIAENFLEDARCFNEVRNMFGFTGTYKGKEVSVMGTGMGCPSIGIYSYELIRHFGCENLIRIGSCGGLQENIELGDILFAMGASTNSNYADQYNLAGTFSAIADFELLETAVTKAREKGYPFRVGNTFCSDVFYRSDDLAAWKKMGILGVEMETFALYCNATAGKAKALGMFTVSDNLQTGEHLSSEERQTGFTHMMEVALETALAL